MSSTCLLCCEEEQYFVLPPCNHTNMCWKCCIKHITGSIFSCPFCKYASQQKSMILFVTSQQMNTLEFQQILKKGPYRSSKNTYYFYSNQEVAKYLEQQTSHNCQVCGEIFQTINQLKKHLHETHRKQFCDVCLQNRKCLNSEQTLFNEVQLNNHLKQGQYSQNGQLTLYHPYCDFCRIRFYDVDSFKVHLRISSHLQCDICLQNHAGQFRYVYYKDYDQIQKHFQKSHFICKQGNCITKKLQNVFVSEDLLQQHRLKVHKKYKGDKQVVNLKLFQPNNEQQLQWDKIGKNFIKEFNILNKTFVIQKEHHQDMIIDIRDFYHDKTRFSHSSSLESITQKYYQTINMYGYKIEDININSVQFYKPLEMSSLTKVQLEKFIHNIFEAKFANPINTIFFTKRNQFPCFYDYFLDIRKRMCQFSKFAYYYAFPQLVRFMKDQNPAKRPMDQFYAQSLHSLKINKQFVFHVKHRYSDMIMFMQQKLQNIISLKLKSNEIDIEIYLQYLKDLNISFYNEHHNELFYVHRDKVTNLYHMIDKCKTQDMLKLNWLLKIGFSTESYELITKKFYFKHIGDCQAVLSNMCPKQYALLYLYLCICLEVLHQKKNFEAKMMKPQSYCLGDILKVVSHNLSKGTRIQIQQAQARSKRLQIKYKQSSNKGVIINQNDYPSLCNLVAETFPTKKPPDNKNLIMFGAPRVSIWNEQQSVHRKKGPIITNNKTQEQQYPSILSNPINTVKQQTIKSNKTRKKEQKLEEDFPVFNFQQKFMTNKPSPKKQTQNPNNKFQQSIGFLQNNKFIPETWNQQKVQTKASKKKKIKQKIIEEDEDFPVPPPVFIPQQVKLLKKNKINAEEEFPSLSTNISKQNQQFPALTPTQIKKQPIKKAQTKQQQDEELRKAMELSMKTFQQQQVSKKNNKQIEPQQIKQGKKKKKNANIPEVGFQNAFTATQKIQPKLQQQQQYRKPPADSEILWYDLPDKKKQKIKLDVSSQEDQQQKIQRQKKQKEKEKQQKLDKKFNIYDHDDFEPIGFVAKKNQPTGESIVNKIMNDTYQKEEKIEKRIKVNRKGKKQIIQRVNLYQL